MSKNQTDLDDEVVEVSDNSPEVAVWTWGGASSDAAYRDV
jgi:hypothetical protein